MGTGHYILADDGKPLRVDDLMAWAAWFEANRQKCIVAQDEVGDVRVSTVFLSVDHNWGDGPPVLWETMIFGGSLNEYQERYSSLENAIAGHATALEMVLNAKTWKIDRLRGRG